MAGLKIMHAVSAFVDTGAFIVLTELSQKF